jgi:hypothetical protein
MHEGSACARGSRSTVAEPQVLSALGGVPLSSPRERVVHSPVTNPHAAQEVEADRVVFQIGTLVLPPFMTWSV